MPWPSNGSEVVGDLVFHSRICLNHYKPLQGFNNNNSNNNNNSTNNNNSNTDDNNNNNNYNNYNNNYNNNDKKLFTEVEVNNGGYLPRRFAAR